MFRKSNITVIYFAICIWLIAGCATTKKDTPTTSPKKRVAVVEFRNESRYSASWQLYEKSALRFLEQSLEQTRKVDVINRDQWQPMLTADSAQKETDQTDVERAVAIGKLAGADIVLIGVISGLDVDSEVTISPLRVRGREYTATSYVKVHVIEVASSQILLTASAIGSAEQTAFYFFAKGPFSVNNINENALLKQALQDAARTLASKIVKQV